MSTRAYIAIRDEDMRYKYIYNHFDSYIDGLGIILYQHYDNTETVKALIELGNTSSIGNTIKNTAQSYKEHLERQDEDMGTVAEFRESRRWEDFWFRDIAWEKCAPKETDNLDDLMIEEYLYIFDIKKSKWYIGYWRDNYNLRSLESVLHSKKLLEQLFSEEYTEEYMLEFHKRCLNA